MTTTDQIEKFHDFIETHYKKKLVHLVNQGKRSLIIDFADLAKYDPELSEELLNEPIEVIAAIESAISQFDIPDELKIRARFTNLPTSQGISIKNIRSTDLRKLITLDGLIRQTSDVRPRAVSARFECPACGNVIKIVQDDFDKFKEPSRCSCGRRGQFKMLSKELIDVQRIWIEEAPESLQGGEQPKRIPIFLQEDLVEPSMERRTTPGAKIRVIGLIKEHPITTKTGATSVRYDLSVEANYIEPIEETYEDMEITPEEEEKIKQLATDPEIYNKLRNSIAPSVYGHDDIKEGLILQMMGGVKKVKSDGTIIRGDMHVLLVGDPGAAKSTLLLFMTKIAPKARYVSGKSSTGAGLTAAVVKDEFLKTWALEGGALVLANGGYCMIDELDKMEPEDRSAMHEALEQQTITISKANINATLRAQTTVLAAANPKLGRFDPYQPIPSQIDLPPTLINRFDLIFPVRDIPNKDTDNKIATRILGFQKDQDMIEPDIPVALMKKYIAYVKQKVSPKLTEGAMEEIKSFYVNLRNQETEGEGIKAIPITARQLEALVRLAEGSARVRLSDKVTRQDAKRAINLLKYCLMQVGFDPETGQIDIDRIGTGITAATRNKMVVIREIIDAFEAKGKKTIPIEDIMAEAMEKGLTERNIEEVIEKLKRSGDIFEPKRGHIQKI
ncbi:MAG: minichromosome maintenance protein MCM [Candidatus Nanoarchaeia archaeon]|nr:minichromosome maintenance protein MCM [Candidatus Nanoarchaeia archaeon]